MPSIATEGLILKRTNFGEADRVVTVLTDRLGKISVVARGVRRITSRRGGNIEVLNRVKLHLFRRKNYTLTEAQSIQTFSVIKQNLNLTTAAFHVIELVDRLTVEGQVNRDLYSLVISVLQLLEKNPRQIFIRAFEVKMLSLLGFWSTDGIQDVDLMIMKLLSDLEYYSWDQINQIEINEQQAVALERVLRYYIERILESKLKSVTVMSKIKNNE